MPRYVGLAVLDLVNVTDKLAQAHPAAMMSFERAPYVVHALETGDYSVRLLEPRPRDAESRTVVEVSAGTIAQVQVAIR